MFQSVTFYIPVGKPNEMGWLSVLHAANTSSANDGGLLFERPQAMYLDADGREVEDYLEATVIHPLFNSGSACVRILAKTERAKKHISIAAEK
jgi:hypothetical protein